MSCPLQRDHHLTVVEWFMRLNDPYSYVGWSLTPDRATHAEQVQG